eukprot:CAMPEP_0194527144 /NCGR_PEP_ID=MMETSP0253-20130528/63138_1 /TAXON_ID=2966 /ORGANISM="Noctiluca scintillans" /LENGTH=673 /DNA_ID=CAMNT_0039372037 /DNA_START=80 /DNA_END=2101 /DNA_ORIENTATION=+
MGVRVIDSGDSSRSSAGYTALQSPLESSGVSCWRGRKSFALEDDDEELEEEDPADMTELGQMRVIQETMVEEEQLRLRLEGLDKLWSCRRKLVEDGLQNARARRLRHETELELLQNPELVEIRSVPEGDQSLAWVDGAVFSLIGISVVILNLITMILQATTQKDSAVLRWVNQVFLVWYIVEFALRAALHSRGLLIGKLSVVWWNWLDLIIVVSGILDQWLYPAISLLSAGHHQDHVANNYSSLMRALRLLRLLRVLRILRVLKVLRFFLQSDLSWTEGPWFQSFISGMILLNALTLGLELDVPWAGWHFLEQAFLFVYSFELAVRLKRWGWKFFYHPEDYSWNILDFVIVSGGVLDQWMRPGFTLVQSLVSGGAPDTENATMDAVMPLLRLMRLARVLRLIRLLKYVRPLLKLTVGVLEAMQGMQWVLLLTLVLLYACGILFTSLVGRGQVYDGDPPEEAQQMFSAVIPSMFMLFRMMTGNPGLMDPLLGPFEVDILFAVFMVISNWVVVAILTAVVSDYMITSTSQRDKADHEEKVEAERQLSSVRLLEVFTQIDLTGDQTLCEEEFKAALDNKWLRQELCDASGLQARDLQDLFLSLSDEDSNGERRIAYNSFVEKLQIEGQSVNQRSFFRIEKHVRHLDHRLKHMEKRFSSVERRIDSIGESLLKLDNS